MRLNDKGQGVVEAIMIVGIILVLFMALVDLQTRAMKLTMEGVEARVRLVNKVSRLIPSPAPIFMEDSKTIDLPLDSLENKSDKAQVRSTIIY